MRQIIQTNKAPEAIGPYSQAIKVCNLVFISGQLPIDPLTGDLVSGIKKETRQALENFKAIVEETGGNLKNVVKTTVYITDMDQFGIINDIYAEYFNEDAPSRACVQVARLPKGANIEIEGIMFLQN